MVERSSLRSMEYLFPSKSKQLKLAVIDIAHMKALYQGLLCLLGVMQYFIANAKIKTFTIVLIDRSVKSSHESKTSMSECNERSLEKGI